MENLLVFILKVISTIFDLGKILKAAEQNLFTLHVNRDVSCSEELRTNLNLYESHVRFEKHASYKIGLSAITGHLVIK